MLIALKVPETAPLADADKMDARYRGAIVVRDDGGMPGCTHDTQASYSFLSLALVYHESTLLISSPCERTSNARLEFSRVDFVS